MKNCLVFGLLTVVLAACSSQGVGIESRRIAGSRDAGAGEAAQSGGSSTSAGTTAQLPGRSDAGAVLEDDAGVVPTRTSLVIVPAMNALTLSSTDAKPIPFKTELSTGGASELDVHWSIDRFELGSIDAKTGVFTPSGAAGVVRVTARAGSLAAVLVLNVFVKIKQEGDPDSGRAPMGAGGLGGVGGEGGGSLISDMPLRAALDRQPVPDAELKWLYPYDGTVWPRGLPAPLLQWSYGAHAPAAVKLRISVEPNFTAEVYLGRPPALAADRPIEHLPIPQALWRNALLSGEAMTVTLTTVARDSAGNYATFTAPQNPTWPIAPTTLKGTVYYNSYGTKLVENFSGAVGGNGRFGGATLAIQRDAFDPTLIAGASGEESGCRVCHTVSADGSLLMVQQANYRTTSAYDLRNANKERAYPATDDGKFGWSALSADGSIAFGNAGPPGSVGGSEASRDTSALYRVSDGVQLTVQGLSSFVTRATTPSFSLDTRKVAFTLFAGPGNATIKPDGKSLVVMDFARIDAMNYAVSNPKALYTATGATQTPGWPAFLPDGTGVVFELEQQAGKGDERLVTRYNARGELWWSDLNGVAHALDRANGKGYLPTGPLNHATDTTLQYEPTVAPIVAGGYAWMVFTSRRLYGNVAKREPFQSDPREADLNVGNADGPTTKKLWVAALSIPAKPDTDPSHPAFYLPAQELFAGNSRGYWVLDACKPSNASCMGGDECCGGYCSFDAEFGVGTCSDVPPATCSKEYDKCNVDADCCPVVGGTEDQRLSCLAGRCAKVSLQ